MEDAADLSRLADIVVPPPVPWWPPAPGWWMVAAALLAVIFILVIAGVQHRHRNAYRRQALAEIDALGPVVDATDLSALSAILKRSALVAYRREQVASLTGSEWLGFLDRTGGDGRFSTTPAFTAAIYGGRIDDGSAPLAAARHWVKRHRAED